MTALDTLVFLTYLVGIVAVGLLLRRRKGAGTEFFLAGRSLSWFPVGLSVMVTLFSAINYAALPTEIMRHGLYVCIAFPVFLLVALPVTRVFMPFYHRLRPTSAYEWLERRFDVRVRLLASALFIVWRLFWMGVALFATARVLGAVTGYPAKWLIPAAGLAAALYASFGGMRAVVWTDVAQLFVLLGSILAALAFALWRMPGGIAGIAGLASQAGSLRPVEPFDPSFFSLDPTIRITLWSGLFGTFAAFLARYGVDQVVVQRYFAARSLRDARRGFWLNIAAALFALTLLTLLGLTAAAWARGSGMSPAMLRNPMAVLAALFRSLPSGVSGLVAAGLLAATMSSVDSGVNACCAAWVTDFHPRAFPRRPVGAAFRTVFSLALGLAAIGLAFVAGQLGTFFVVVNKVIHGFGGPLLAIALLGMFSRSANGPGMLWGGALGAVVSVVLTFTVRHLALHYYALANLLLTLALCLIASWIAERYSGATGGEPAWRWPGPDPDGPES